MYYTQLKQFLAVSHEKSDLSSKAKRYTTSDVAGLLVKISLENYVQAFKESDVDGELVYGETGYSTLFSDLGMTSAVDQLKLLARFRLELSEVSKKSVKVESLLDRINLDRYSPDFKRCAFDCEMLLFDNIELVLRALTEVGVKSSLDKLRILVFFRKTLSGKSFCISVEDVFQCLESDKKLEVHCDLIKAQKIDGDMLLFESESLVRVSLEEVGVKKIDARKIQNKVKDLKLS